MTTAVLQVSNCNFYDTWKTLRHCARPGKKPLFLTGDHYITWEKKLSS